MPLQQEFSWTIFLTLALIFLGSMAMFFVLVRRWTIHRRWTMMSEWARERRFKHLPINTPLPPPLDELDLIPQLLVSSGPTTFFDFSPTMSEDQRPIHIMHRRIDIAFAPAGLRPIHSVFSFLDRFKLSAFPLITGNERFLAVGIDSAAARQIADSARTLLPSDLGLLFHGPAMLIDFSSRQFDTIEFDRMIALSDQLLTHLFKYAKTR